MPFTVLDMLHCYLELVFFISSLVPAALNLGKLKLLFGLILLSII